MLDDSAARWLLVLHTALGAAAVGAATHLVVWLYRYVRGRGNRGAVVRFSWLVLALQLAAFMCGNVMYPTYKVEVRAAYLENAPAIVKDRTTRDEDLARVVTREHGDPVSGPATSELDRQGAADPRRGAGHDGDLVPEALHRPRRRFLSSP